MSATVVPVDRIAASIRLLRGQKVMPDFDLAVLHGVTTRILNQAVKRNAERFPSDFTFRLNQEEVAALEIERPAVRLEPPSDSENSKSQSVILKRGRNFKYRPYAFTEQGVTMLSSVLRSDRAVQVNIAIMRAFVQLRAANKPRREIGFHVREHSPRYGTHQRQ